jgi:sterol desaturase/sphingolipid hydroxylase (fatty acid hydroxylase superfamily)
MISTFPDLVALAIPAFVLLIFAEMLWARRYSPNSYHPGDLVISMLIGLTAFLAGLFFASPAHAITSYVAQFRLSEFSFAWWIWILCILADDFLHYALHRVSHHVRFLWASHVVHHSSQHFNLVVGLRQSATIVFLSALIFRLPLVLIGFPLEMVALVITGNQIYQFWTHSEAVRNCPRWFEFIFTTPNHHRVHHAANPEYLDRNYGGVFILWDRMFGTFTEVESSNPPRYGLVQQLGRFNILICIFHEWSAIARDMWHAPWRYKLAYFFAPPGWSHDGSRETSDQIKARWRSLNADAGQKGMAMEGDGYDRSSQSN